MLCALLIGYLAGSFRGDEGSDVGDLMSGVVDSVDNDGSTVCIKNGSVECYQLPGGGLEVGQRIHFRIEQMPIDPSDPDGATQPMVVYVAE